MKCFFLFLFVLSFYCSVGQFNDTTNYYVNYSSTGIINKTNGKSSYVLNNNLRFSISRKRVSMNTTNAWVYGKQQSDLTNNDFSSGLDFNVYNKGARRRFYYWGLGIYESSFSLKIHHRLQTGAGIGYNVIDRPNVVVILSDGILYEKSDLYTGNEIFSNDYETFRNSFRLKYRWLIWNNIVFEGTDFIQHSLSDRKDYILRLHANLSIKLQKWLSFTTSVTYNKLTSTRRENFLLNFGLTVEKYF